MARTSPSRIHSISLSLVHLNTDAHVATQWAHNWLVMFTYLQHSDPTVPYYREVRVPAILSMRDSLMGNQKSWTFARGALATVDRPVFGWIGVFFWNNVSVFAGFLLFFTD